MPDVRLIERWLPIAALGEESVRERRSMTALPPIYYLHVWWARRPLVASRAAIMASLLPADADRDKFMQVLGIHGDPVAARKLLDRARRTGVRIDDPYSYGRAFGYCPTPAEVSWFRSKTGGIETTIVDPTAGGGSIPFEACRLGVRTSVNDLNPVAAAILAATVDFPIRFGTALTSEFESISAQFRQRAREQLEDVFPQPLAPSELATTYLWARTITCPYCAGLIPLSPNWRLAPGGLGVRLVPQCQGGPGAGGRICDVEIVRKETEQSQGTISDGDALCPFPDCGRVIDGEEVKRQAQNAGMGDQLFAVVYKRRIETKLKSGKRGKDKWERGYRAPRPEDDNAEAIKARLAEKLVEWEALDVVPNEAIPPGNKTDEPLRYGMRQWRDAFSPRQLLGHGISAEIFRTMVEEDRAAERLTDIRRAAYVYLSFSLDKLLNYNSRMSVWMSTREVIANTFNRHDFAFCWSYAEMATTIEDLGYDWAIEQTAKSIKELVELASASDGPPGGLFGGRSGAGPQPATAVTCKPGDALDHIVDASVDAVIMDPPYGANVMYAELSDFFYVWLKRTAGLVKPELFTRYLADKDAEAVANKAKFKGQKGADALANRDYRDKMQSIFAECRRILKPDGIMTVMFTHKDTGAWDALTKGLIEAGFAITASWPVNTEAEGSLHIKDKAAANSTIFLVCRPRPADGAGDTTYWEDVEPLVAKAVRTRVEEFQKAGIGGVDLYLASFGPALEEFSRHWPLKRGTPRPEPVAKRRRKQAELFEEEFDPFAVTPEDALDAARREVKTWRLNQLTHLRGRADLDPITSWFVLAWDAFKAPVFAYDEGLRLARAVGVDLDGQLIGRICEKKGSDLKLWDSKTRAEKGSLGGADGARSMLDALHHAAHRARTRTLEAAREMLDDSGLSDDPTFLAAMEAVLEVLPPSRTFTQVELTGDLKSASDDFDALEKLRRLAFADKVDEPKQLDFWAEEAA
jgi:adenine-specific DNA methylase